MQGKVNPAFGTGHSAQGSFLPQLFLTYLCKSSFLIPSGGPTWIGWASPTLRTRFARPLALLPPSGLRSSNAVLIPVCLPICARKLAARHGFEP